MATEVDEFSEGPPDNTKKNMDINLMVNSDSDTDDGDDLYEENTFVGGRIVQEEVYEQLNLWRHSDDVVVHQMTGDRLRKFHAKYRTQFGAEESTLRELDQIRRFHKMEFPEKPCIFAHYGDLDLYLKKEWKNLEAKKKEARKDFLLQKKPWRSLEEKVVTPISELQPIGRSYSFRDIT